MTASLPPGCRQMLHTGAGNSVYLQARDTHPRNLTTSPVCRELWAAAVDGHHCGFAEHQLRAR